MMLKNQLENIRACVVHGGAEVRTCRKIGLASSPLTAAAECVRLRNESYILGVRKFYTMSACSSESRLYCGVLRLTPSPVKPPR